MARMTSTLEPAMTRRRARRWARLVVVATIALAVVYVFVSTMAELRDPFQVVALWYFVPGALVVLRRDDHVIGWLLITNGLTWALHAGTEVAVTTGGLAWMSMPWRAWLYQWVGNAQWTATVALFVLFPDGLADRTPAQRRTARAMIAVALAATAAAMAVDPVGRDFPSGPQPNPTGLGFLDPVAGDFTIMPVVVVAICSVVGLWRRGRRVTGVRRRQYTWVLFAFAVVVAGLLIGLVLDSELGDAAWYPIVAGWFLVPTAFSVAILRYRLYDIDRIISRTVAYAVITVVVAGIYTVPVVALPELFDLRGPLPVAAATLGAAAAFSPVRRVVQAGVDRHFNRARFDAQRELDAFSARLRSEVDLDAVVTDINAMISTTLQPSLVTTWVRGTPTRG
jgi:hypothetical protein